MTKISMMTIAALLIGSTALAADCSYCAKLDALKSDFAKTKPDPEDRATAEKQGALVDRAIDLGEEVLKAKELSAADVERLTSLLVTVIPYDNANTAAEVLQPLLKPHWSKFAAEARKQRSLGKIKPSELTAFEENFAIAEKVLKHGTDRSIEEIEAAEKVAPRKK